MGKAIKTLDTADVQAQLDELRQRIVSNTDKNTYVSSFKALMGFLRTKKKYRIYANDKMEHLLQALRKDKAFLNALQNVFNYLVKHRDFTSLFTEVGLLKSGSFFKEILQAIRHKILPPMPDKRSMEFLLSETFNKHDDYKLINGIESDKWHELFVLIGDKFTFNKSPLYYQLMDALSILSYRIQSIAFNEELSRWKYKSGKHKLLLEQNKKTQWLIHILQDPDSLPELIQEYIDELLSILKDCISLIKDIESNSIVYGTSLEQSHIIARTKQQIYRMNLILQILSTKPDEEEVVESTVDIFSKTVEYINKRYSITEKMSQSANLIAFQVSEHKRETGEHYITTSRKEYFGTFISAVKGGLIICIAALIKALLHYVHMPKFWDYFLYGLNYALAFIIMYLLHATLATKQPAMTAAALAAAMDPKTKHYSPANISIVFARVWRTQFASFMGNIITVFPVCIGIAMLFFNIYDTHLLSPIGYAEKMLHAQDPSRSLSMIFAAFTGVFLFLSGIITGYVDNKVIHGNIPNRILESPKFKKNFSPRFLHKFSQFVKNHAGSITGNFFLGMVLGYAPWIGEMFGVPFDIRHITISTAYYAFSIVGLDFQLLSIEWIGASVGVILIGFINFAVSFGLAFITAMRSRNISFAIIPSFLAGVGKMVLRYPLDFIFPPRKPRTPQDLAGKS